MRLLTPALLFSLLVAPLPAQQLNSRPWGGFFSIDLLTSQFTGRQGQSLGYGSRGWGFDLGGGASYRDMLLMGADFGLALFKDDSSFSEGTTGGTKESGTDAYFGSLFVGLRSRSLMQGSAGNRGLWVGALYGYSGWNGSRSIANCVGCSDEDLNMRGGSFVEPFVVFGGLRQGFAGVKVSYRAFLVDASSVRNVIYVGFMGGSGR